jgi:hypothetical protein
MVALEWSDHMITGPDIEWLVIHQHISGPVIKWSRTDHFISRQEIKACFKIDHLTVGHKSAINNLVFGWLLFNESV